jgi:hypothetical protein
MPIFNFSLREKAEMMNSVRIGGDLSHPEKDGYLTMADVFALQLNGDLVLLIDMVSWVSL